MLSANNIWLPLIYLYGVGGLIFIASMVLILATGACNLRRASDRTWFAILIFGFVWYVAIHTSWYLAAIYIDPMPDAPIHVDSMPDAPPAEIMNGGR